MKIQEAILKFWPRLLLSILPLCLGVVGVNKNLFEIQWLILFIILSLLSYRKVTSSIELHEDRLQLKGPLFWGSFREMPLDKIRFIDATSITGKYSFRIGFDASIMRSPFWRGADDLFFLSPALFDSTEAIIRDIIKSHSNIKVESRAQDLLDGKKKNPKYISVVLFGGVLLLFIIGMILMLKSKL